MKVKINNLPEGMSLEDGKLVPMQEGGATTGDQIDFGLTTIPTTVSGSQMYDGNDKDVRYSLSSVPRDMANIEAEGGETVLTDLNNDGQFGLYNITGPRHSSGGVPMFLPEQSFIFSDTNELKMKKEELKEFGIDSRKSKTPADVSKKFELNKFYGAIEDEYADDIQVRSAEIMLKKNKFDLSKLAFGQEFKKDFEEGVPLAAHPYLVSIGQDPIEFTAKVEEITEQKAQQKAFDALPFDQQQQILALQQIMAQAQQAQQSENQPMGESAGGQMMANQELPEAQYGFFGGRNRDTDGDGIPNIQDRFPLDPLNGRGSVVNNTGNRRNRRETVITTAPEEGTDPILESLVGGSPEYLRYYDSDRFADARALRYKAYVAGAEQAGNEPVSAEQFHKYYKDAQRRNFEVYKYAEENPEVFEDAGLDIKSQGLDRGFSLDENGGYATKELRDIINIYNEKNKLKEGFIPLTVPTKEETLTFQQGYITNLQQQGIEEYKKMIAGDDYDEEILGSYFTEGVDDEGDVVLNPAWKEGDDPAFKFMKSVSKADTWYGNTTLGQKDLLKIAKTYKPTEEIIVEEDPFTPPNVGPAKPAPVADFWKQDLLKLNSIANREREMFLPWQPEVEDVQIGYDVIDPTRTIAAINEQASTLMNANNAYAGPSQGSARNSAAVGKAMTAIANAVNDVQAKNVGIVNRGEYQNAVLDSKINRERRDRNVKEYDDTIASAQVYMDEKNFDREQYADAYANALTNRANTYNMNLTQDYFQIDPMTGGMINQVDGRAFDAQQPVDYSQQYLNAASALKREGIEPTAEMIGMMVAPQQSLGQSNIQAEYNRLYNNPNLNQFGVYAGNDTNMTTANPGYVQRIGGEKKLKRMAVPFYSGKMLP